MSKSPWSLARFETARYRRGGQTISRLVIAVRWKAPGELRRRRHRFSTGQPDTPSMRKTWRPKLRQIADEMGRDEFDPQRWFPGTLHKSRSSREHRSVKTLERYAQDWLAELAGAGVSVGTREDYRMNLRAHLFGTPLAEMPMREITDGDIKRFVGALTEKKTRRGPLAASTINNKVIARLRTIFALAAKRGDIARDPMVLVPNQRMPDTEVDPFTPDEMVAIFASATTLQYRALYILLALSGLRPNEALGLEWQHVDFGARIIYVRQQMTESGKPTQTLKTRQSKRDVEMFEPVRAALIGLRQANQLRSRWVFANHLGRPLKERTVGDDPWRKAIAKAGLKYRKLYNFRHSYTSLMLSAGKPLQWVASQLGHVGVRKIDEVYGRWLRTPASERINLDAFFGRILGKPVSLRLADRKSESA